MGSIEKVGYNGDYNDVSQYFKCHPLFVYCIKNIIVYQPKGASINYVRRLGGEIARKLG